MFPVTLWFRSGEGERKSLRNFVILPISNTVPYSEDPSGFSLLALSTMDAYTRNENGSQWIRQNRVISSWKFCPLRSLSKVFYFMSLSVTTLHYFAILLGNLHKASTLYRDIFLGIQRADSSSFGFFFPVLSDEGLKGSNSDNSMWKETFSFL